MYCCEGPAGAGGACLASKPLKPLYLWHGGGGKRAHEWKLKDAMDGVPKAQSPRVICVHSFTRASYGVREKRTTAGTAAAARAAPEASAATAGGTAAAPPSPSASVLLCDGSALFNSRLCFHSSLLHRPSFKSRPNHYQLPLVPLKPREGAAIRCDTRLDTSRQPADTRARAICACFYQPLQARAS